MFQAIRRRIHLSPATAIATLALVFAMTGGAYAAKRYLIISTSQISPKVLKSLQGKAGPAGKNGANGANGAAGAKGETGPAGPAGPQGEKGTNGTNGTNGANGAAGAKGETGPAGPAGPQGEKGTNGTNGTNGESVTGKSIASGGSKCRGQAGVEYTLKSTTTEVCNGQTGFTTTLPAGETETGAWSFTFGKELASEGGLVAGVATVSFPIPLASQLNGSNIKFLQASEFENGSTVTGCPSDGTELETDGKAPKAEPGFLCVYIISTATGEPTPFVATSNAGGVVFAATGEETEEGEFAYGAWAVTAE